MQYKQVRALFHQELQAYFPSSEIEEIMQRCVTFWSGKSKLELLFDAIEIDDMLVENTLYELKQHKPIQYILGFEYFGDLTLKVNAHVLIPRPETVELCSWIMEEIDVSNPHTSILDIGTGSGCIPVYLKSKIKNLELHALDISSEALAVAAENAKQHDCTIHFFLLDILKARSEDLPNVDIIVSNPPYILSTEQVDMAKQVLQFEPHQALFVQQDDPLQFYKHIAALARNKQQIYFEVHQNYALQTEAYFQQQGFFTSLRKDMYGNLRMLKAWT